MFKDIIIGQYVPGNSPLHKMNPPVKIIMTILYIVLLFILKNPISYVVFTIYTITLILISGVPFKMILKGLKPMLWIFIFTAVLNVFMTPGDTVWALKIFKFTLKITKEGIESGSLMVIRLLYLVMGTSLLTLTTSPLQLTDGIEKLLKPFNKIKVPSHEIAMMMTIAIRFIPTLAEETDKIMKAQMARGADFETGNIINNKYIAQEEFKEEGVFNRIYTDLNKLSRSLNLKISSLDKEKESIKELVTDISHQLKTPLASLKLYNTLLIEEELDDEDRIEFLKTNEMSINKLHNLIDSLVNISRLEASMINIKIENKSIKQTLIKAINSTVPKANQKNININIEDFEDIEIPHDTKWTEESIFNVLENAVKYSSENKDINVQVSETINFIRIDIKDNGIGIDKSEYNNIFKRFYRSEKVDDIEGSGIGLYLSRKILEKQGGNIIVSSQKEQGSKFSLFLTKV